MYTYASQKGQKYPAESLRRDEILALLDACGKSNVGKRNRALIVVMWRSGLRLAEALALRPQDLDFDALTIRVLHGKGDKPRTVGFDLAAARVLREWMEVRPAYVKGGPRNAVPVGTPLFCTSDGKPLLQSYVREMLPRLAQKAGVERRVHAHIFRHTFAVELVRAGVSIVHIQRLLGHTSLATTSTYLASLSPEEALDAVRTRKDWDHAEATDELPSVQPGG